MKASARQALGHIVERRPTPSLQTGIQGVGQGEEGRKTESVDGYGQREGRQPLNESLRLLTSTLRNWGNQVIPGIFVFRLT